jgi:anti-anti-sigma factor
MDQGDAGSTNAVNSKLTITFRRDVGDRKALVVTFAGDASLSHVDELASMLVRLSAGHAALTVFDVSGLSGISSLAMGQLVAYRNTVRMYGGEVRLAMGESLVRGAIEKAQLHRIMQTFATADEALAK